MSKTKKEQGNELYQNLAYLFYAVAMADHDVHKKELEKLNELVKEHWLEVDDIEDAYGTDAAFQIATVFDWLLDQGKNGNEAYEDFEEYYLDHKLLFTPPIKNLAKSTSRAIAASFSGNNKSELLLLGRLELLFKS